MNRSALITLPNSDSTVICVSEWNKKVLIPTLTKNSINYHTLTKGKLNKKHVTFSIKKENPRLLILNGHGSYDCICGQGYEKIIELDDNDNLLNNRIVHSFTCSSGKELGSNSKAESFVGYDDVFVFWMHRTTSTKPLKDKLATPQMICALTVPNEIIKGKSVGEAYNISQNKYNDLIHEYKWNSSKYTKEEIQRVLPFLMWNKSQQKIYGNKNAKL